MRRLADRGVAILFYSTDYDELIGSCDRVAVRHDGRILRELSGDRLTEHDLVAAAMALPDMAQRDGVARTAARGYTDARSESTRAARAAHNLP